MFFNITQILGKSFGKMYLQCITEKYKVIWKEMGSFREYPGISSLLTEPIPFYKGLVFPGYRFSRV